MALKIKFYPKHSTFDNPSGGFTSEDIQKGLHWIYADIECPHCGKLQAVSSTGYLGGPCVRCGHFTNGNKKGGKSV